MSTLPHRNVSRTYTRLLRWYARYMWPSTVLKGKALKHSSPMDLPPGSIIVLLIPSAFWNFCYLWVQFSSPLIFNVTRTRLQRHSGLACLEIRWRNEEAINSTRNMIYSLKVFYFLLYRRRCFLFVSELISTLVSDDQKYLCGSRLYACMNTRKFKGLDSRETTSLPDIQKVICMARHFNHRPK